MERKARSMTLENYTTEFSGATGLQITIANADQQIKVAATCFSTRFRWQEPKSCYMLQSSDFSQRMSMKQENCKGEIWRNFSVLNKIEIK